MSQERRLKAFGRQLKEYLKRKGLAQKDLARELNLSEYTVSRIATGAYKNLTEHLAKTIITCDVFLDVGLVETVGQAEAWLRLADPAWSLSPAEREELRGWLKEIIGEPLEQIEALDEYHRQVLEDHANLELTGFYEEQREPVTLPLDRVFVSLKLTGGDRDKGGHGELGPGRTEAEPKSFAQALKETARAGKHLVIVGGAGSGKTTFLRYAAGALAEAQLHRNPALAMINRRCGAGARRSSNGWPAFAWPSTRPAATPARSPKAFPSWGSLFSPPTAGSNGAKGSTTAAG